MIDWDKAPEWANWVVQGADGSWRWLEFKPNESHKEGVWWEVSMGRHEPAILVSNKRNSLHTRPKRECLGVKSVDILRHAVDIQKERAAEYEAEEGERSMARIVRIFNAHHDTELTETQGWHFMQILKDVRLFNAGTFHYDSALDGVSYCALKAESIAKERQ